MEQILRVKDVSKITQMSVGTIYRLVKAGKFPAGRKIGVRASGWRQSDIDKWIAEKFED